MVARRAAGEPLEYIVGWAEFRGISLAVDRGVFVPRARSGFLVDQAALQYEVFPVFGPGQTVRE
jgi:release factor glutamine methyltransferase